MEKKRCNNFTKDEVEVLVSLVEEHKDIIECKKTDTVTNSNKEDEWRKIEIKFNVICATGRTAKMLRSKWESLKKSTKKEYGEYRQNLYRTGGGPPVEFKVKGVGDRVLAIIGIGATGVVSQYDCDFVSEESLAVPDSEAVEALMVTDSTTGDTVDVSNNETYTVVDNVEVIEMVQPSCTWNSWNPQQLKKAKSKALNVSNCLLSVRDSPTAADTQFDVSNTYKMATKAAASLPVMQNEPDKLQTPKTDCNPTKRKRLYKAECVASKLQKQRSGTVYEELARKKMEYIDFQMNLLKDEAERKEKRLAEKHDLEIKILKAELKNKENCLGIGTPPCWLATLVILQVEIALCIQFQTVELTGSGDDECALLLNGPGRSSQYDYTLNLLRGTTIDYSGPHTCITFDAVNAAYLDARKRIRIAQPHGDWKPEDVATVGELLLDVSINLARIYGLSYEDIEKGLPLIDTSKTLIREICPPFLSNVECRAGKYRRFDGLCTNLDHPTWGAINTPFTRLLGPLYADGMNAPRISVSGRPLPLSRVVSRTMHPDEGFHDHAGTVMVIAWGQFMDHDYTLQATPLDPFNRNDPEECCKRPPHLKHPYCNEIQIPEDDYFYRLFHVKCIDFVRTFPGVRPGCRLGSRVPYNTLTGVLDANTVYGVTEKFARKLREGVGGLLRMNPAFDQYGLKDLLPLKLDVPDEGCTRPNASMYCFEAGEIRVNEQLVLTCMHTLMAREHNRLAKELAHVNPHWDDETLFQEARRINIAIIQHVTYNEFLPILLGKDVMEKFGLLLQKDGYWNGYDSSINPGVIDAFAAAAYRFGHSLLPTAVERWSKAHKFIASKRLSDLIRRPYDLYRAGVLDEYFMGLMNQVAQAMDDSITQEVTNHLFKKVGARFGMDLVSFNMQRGREFGLPGYMEFRKFCGLPTSDSFEDMIGSMSNQTVRKYASIFEHPNDVDLWSGGVCERPLPGGMLGPTFACIIATQFSYSRRGDRFWYELPNQPSSFTLEQLNEIRKVRLARLICDNTDLIDTIQLYPMVLPDHEINPRVPCRSRVIPSIDLSKWAEFPHENAFSNSFQYEPLIGKK